MGRDKAPSWHSTARVSTRRLHSAIVYSAIALVAHERPPGDGAPIRTPTWTLIHAGLAQRGRAQSETAA
jgi:hypothetical protein